MQPTATANYALRHTNHGHYLLYLGSTVLPAVSKNSRHATFTSRCEYFIGLIRECLKIVNARYCILSQIKPKKLKNVYSHTFQTMSRDWFYSEGVSKTLLGKFGTRLPDQRALGPTRPQYGSSPPRKSKILYSKLFFQQPSSHWLLDVMQIQRLNCRRLTALV